MPRRLPPGCVEDRDRHGNIRIYYRAKGDLKSGFVARHGRREFMDEYDAAKCAAAPNKSRKSRPAPGGGYA